MSHYLHLTKRTLIFSFDHSDIDATNNEDNDDARVHIINDIDDSPGAEQVAVPDAEPHAENGYDLIENAISAIKANTTSADRQIDAMTRKITTIAKTTGSTTISMARMKLDMAAIKAMMKDMAGKGKKGKKRSRIRRYKEKRISKKSGEREGGGQERAGWIMSDRSGRGEGGHAIFDRVMQLYMKKAQGSSFPMMR